MHPRTRESITLGIMALVILVVIVGLILLIFLVTGHFDLLSQMLQSTVKGTVFGLVIRGVGPLGMWIAIFVLLLFAKRGAAPGAIKLYLRFPSDKVPPPTEPANLPNVECWYLVRSNGEVRKQKQAQILTEKVETIPNEFYYVPYVYVKPLGIENPEFQVVLQHEGRELKSDSFSPEKGSVDFQ